MSLFWSINPPTAKKGVRCVPQLKKVVGRVWIWSTCIGLNDQSTVQQNKSNQTHLLSEILNNHTVLVLLVFAFWLYKSNVKQQTQAMSPGHRRHRNALLRVVLCLLVSATVFVVASHMMSSSTSPLTEIKDGDTEWDDLGEGVGRGGGAFLSGIGSFTLSSGANMMANEDEL